MRGLWLAQRPKMVAALTLGLSVALPLYSIQGPTGASEQRWPASLAVEDGELAVLLAVAYLWPLLILGTMLVPRTRGLRVAVSVCEPVLPLVSALVLWAIGEASMVFVAPLGAWLLIPVHSSLAIGGIVALAANAAYLAAWGVAFVPAVRSRRVEEAT